MKILFLVMDTVRRDFLSFYGNDWVRTPNLAKLSGKSVVFDNHWAGSLPCMPARREFMTGRYNFMYRGWGPIEVYDDVLPRLMREKGVFSHLLTDHQHYFELGGENYHTAFNTWEFFRGQEYDPWVSLVDGIALPERLEKREGWTVQQNHKNRMRQQKEEDFSSPRTCAAAAAWLEDNKKADNWFLQVELFDPHEPYTVVQKYLDLYGDTWEGPLFDWPEYAPTTESAEAIEHVRKRYAALLTMADHWVGVMLGKLEALGLYDETMIAFTTDHGTLLGEHGYWNKYYPPMYNEITRIPMTMKFPKGWHGGERVGHLTQTIDVMPTFLEFSGTPNPPHLHGKSMVAAVEGKTIRENALFGYFGMATNLTDGKHVYLRNPVNADAGPLHAYTSTPVAGLNHYFPRSEFERVEMGRYFGHTYNLPLYKIPTRGQTPRALAGEAAYTGRHQLFDVVNDPGQKRPILDAALEGEFARRMTEMLKGCEAPAEQFTRLGLER